MDDLNTTLIESTVEGEVVENIVVTQDLTVAVETPNNRTTPSQPNTVYKITDHDIEDVTMRRNKKTSSVRSATTSLKIESLDEGGRFEAFSKLTLTWKDITVTADMGTGKGCCKQSGDNDMRYNDILKGVSGIVEPGQFIAIMGASGSGKTSLLNTLAFRNDSKLKVSGTVKANGVSMTKSQMKLISAYVQQDDYFIGTLTVREVMLFHAHLRMDKNISSTKKRKTVDSILGQLGLTKVANSLCGYPGGLIRGISGGERKRLSVATELLMDPPLLFIDEPTSGLDSFMAESIVTLIGKLARANRTVLCTIHQPTSEVFALFDKVCLVAEGQIAFMGPAAEALDHFSTAGWPCPSNFNPADHYIFTLAIKPGLEEKCKARCSDLTDYYKRSDCYTAIAQSIDEAERLNTSKITSINRDNMQSSLIAQVGWNFKRSFLNTIRNPGYTRMRVAQTIVMGLLCGLAYFNMKNDQTVAQNKSGALFFIVMSFTFGNVFIQAQSIPLELPVIKREYQNGMYSTLPYLISKIITEIPYLIILPLLQISILYFMIGLQADVSKFLICTVCCILVSWSSTGLGLFIATWTGDIQIAGAIAAPIVMPFFLFGGLYQNDKTTPVYFQPIKYVSWFRYGFNMLMVNEFDGLNNITCAQPGPPCLYTNGTQILTNFGIKPDELWWPNVMVLGVFGVVTMFFAWTCLICRVRR